MEYIKNLFLSSTGDGLAKRWETFFTGLIPIIVVVSQLFGWGVTDVDLNDLMGQVTIAISSLVAVWKVIEHIQGWARAKFYKDNQLGKYSE